MKSKLDTKKVNCFGGDAVARPLDGSKKGGKKGRVGRQKGRSERAEDNWLFQKTTKARVASLAKNLDEGITQKNAAANAHQNLLVFGQSWVGKL